MKEYILDYRSDISGFWSYRRGEIFRLSFVAGLVGSVMFTVIITVSAIIAFPLYLMLSPK